MKIRFNFVKYLANLKFAIFLLFAIAGSSVIGSVIEQNQSSEFYQINYQEPFLGFIDSNIILKLEFDHIFKSWWFIALLILFGLSLTCCTFLQQLPALERVRKIKFYKKNKEFKRFSVNAKAFYAPTGPYIVNLRQKNYKIFQNGRNLYASKGLIGRVSPILVHFSMVLILFGTILASTSGFIAQEFVPETEIFYIQNVLNYNLNTFVPQISGRINDFWISYKEDLTIKQFYTDLSLLDKQGNEIKRETIYVNHPLKYKSLTFYQTDWNVIGFRIKSNNRFYQLPVINKNKQVYVSWIPATFTDSPSEMGYTVLNLGNRGIGSLYNHTGSLISKIEVNEPFGNFGLVDLIGETGIQIKVDPGLIIIYFGFFLLIISIFSSYLSYSQVWLILNRNNVRVYGMTNRSKITFKFEMLNLIFKLQAINADGETRTLTRKSH